MLKSTRIDLVAYRVVLRLTYGPITRWLGRRPGRWSEAWTRLAHWLADRIYCRRWGHHFVEIDDNNWTLICALCDKAVFK